MRRKKKQPRHRQKKNRQQLAYPDPETWRKIVAQRDQILKRFLYGIAEGNPGVVDNLVNEYGVYQVRYVLENFQKHARPSFLVDEAAIYHHYRWLFAQFGGDRPFLSKQAYDAAVRAEIHDPEQVQYMLFGSSSPDDIRESVRLVHLAYATDITPPDVPPKPAGFSAPAPHSYSPMLKPLLSLGWQLDESAMATHLSHRAKWRRVLPELGQMATDPGLVNGWPGEKASWAPYHALTLLGHLQNPDFAAGLLDLLLVENDWLTDRLPGVWAQMGPDAALPLWDALEEMIYEDDKLAVLIAGLLSITQTHPDQFDSTVHRFIKLLDAGTIQHADLNAYLVFALDQLGDETAVSAIETALAEERVNTRIMGLDSIKLLGATFDWD